MAIIKHGPRDFGVFSKLQHSICITCQIDGCIFLILDKEKFEIIIYAINLVCLWCGCVYTETLLPLSFPTRTCFICCRLCGKIKNYCVTYIKCDLYPISRSRNCKILYINILYIIVKCWVYILPCSVDDRIMCSCLYFYKTVYTL